MDIDSGGGRIPEECGGVQDKKSDIVVERNRRFHMKSERSLSLEEALFGALMLFYDSGYRGLYGGHDSFMIDMFGCERSKIALKVMKDFITDRASEYKNIHFSSFDVVVNLYEGDFKFKLETFDKRTLMVDWLESYGPSCAYLEE